LPGGTAHSGQAEGAIAGSSGGKCVGGRTPHQQHDPLQFQRLRLAEVGAKQQA
jgi:hypothetical protein